MNRAFVFDMDGVIIDSETVWEEYDKKLFTSLLGAEKFLKIKDTLLGSTVHVIYDAASKLGLEMDKNRFMQQYDEVARSVYKDAQLTKGIDELIKKLDKNNFRIGLLTASPPSWIEQVLLRLKTSSRLEYVVSLAAREDLRPKPYPDGYLEVIKKLGSIPEKTIILEDANKGIAAAKTSGALTICLKENLPKSYKPVGADLYMNNLQEVIAFIETYE
jgi:HAD superfamily hydrolase (TIGR01509 family)